MKVTFISQASLIIETEDATIWTDPWLFGTAFNDSWKLFPPAEFDKSWYDKINFLWISHEHPDHFHIPTLMAMPREFKERVTLLFQKNNSDKMPKAFREKLGFKNLVLLKNRKLTQITSTTKILNTQIGQMDSSLAVTDGKHTVLNLNDCEINSKDAKRYVRDLGKIDVVFNQFSIAGYNGQYEYEKFLPAQAARVLDTMVENHKDLKATTSVPIASYVRFCTEDNKHVNQFANSPDKVKKRFEEADLDCHFMYINDMIDLNNLTAHNSDEAFEKLQAEYLTLDQQEYDKGEIIPYETIEVAFKERAKQLKTKFSGYFRKKLKSLKIFVPDLNIGIRICLYDGTFEKFEMKTEDDFDLQIASQPFFFAFKFPWGLQTLGVSARYFIKEKGDIWKWYRIITSLNNAEIYLKFKYFFRRKFIAYLFTRLKGGLNQLKYQLRRMDQ